MPKIPQRRPAMPLSSPLAAAGLKQVFVDRANDRVRLLTLKPEHVTPEIAEWLTDPAVMEGINAPRQAMGLEAFRAYVASFDNLRRNLMTVRMKEDDRPVGLLLLEVDLRHKVGSMHICIGSPGDRGLSIAYAASALLVRHAFTERNLEKLTFQPLERNVAAIAACERYGLKLEGILRSHRIDGRTGERLDQRVYGLTLEEFNAIVEMRRKAGTLPPFEGPGLKRA